MKNEFELTYTADVRDDRFNKVQEQLEKMQKRAQEFCQTRSNFQLEKFIACDEYTDITRFRHVAHNSYVAMQEVRRMILDRERKLRELERLENCIEYQVPLEKVNSIKSLEKPINADPHYKDYDLDIFETSRQLEDTEIRIKGLLKEIDYMEAICNELEKREITNTGSGFTAEKYQEREPAYWEKRLSNQMHRSQQANALGIGEGNYMSYLMGIEDTILPESNQQMHPVPLTPNDLAVVALKDREGVNRAMLQSVDPNAGKQLNE